MLENLTSRIGKIITGFSSTYRISDSNLKDILKDFRQSFIEADVSWEVTKNFLNGVKNKVVELEITKKVSPGNLLLKVINDELLSILSFSNKFPDLSLDSNDVSRKVVLLFGLQGAGKTTTCAKLARFFKNKNKSVVLTSSDIKRAAAIKQLRDLSVVAGVDFFDPPIVKSAVHVADLALNYFLNSNKNILLFDTAGRLHIDNDMLDELTILVKKLNPTELLLVVDGMVGQDAINSTKTFSRYFDISGFIVTKMDGDSRGGVILSLTYLTKLPIKYICYGESLDCINVFYPDRIVSRILGMGDLNTLLEDINKVIDEEDTKLLYSKTKNIAEIDLNVFRFQLKQMLKIGGIDSLISKLPGMHLLGNLYKKKINDNYFVSMLAVIDSMTVKERKYPNLINGSRKKRIAFGSGTNIQVVNNLLKQFNNMKKVCGKFSNPEDIEDFLKKKLNFIK